MIGQHPMVRREDVNGGPAEEGGVYTHSESRLDASTSKAPMTLFDWKRDVWCKFNTFTFYNYTEPFLLRVGKSGERRDRARPETNPWFATFTRIRLRTTRRVFGSRPNRWATSAVL
jgi:hypothetical protein